MKNCPNKNSEEWKHLVTSYGEDVAFILYDRAGGDIPSSSKAKSLFQETGIIYQGITLAEKLNLNLLNSEGKIKSLPYERALSWANTLRKNHPEYKVSVSKSPVREGLYSLLVESYSIPNNVGTPVELFTDFYMGDDALREQENYQLIQDNQPVDKQLDRKVSEWLSKLGVRYEASKVIYDRNGNPINAVAKADLLRNIVSVIENKADVTTLSEEAAHFLVEFLEGNPLRERLLRVARASDTFKRVKEQYAEVYDNDESIAVEAAGKLIAQEIVKEWNNNSDEYVNETPAIVRALKNVWNKILEFLRLKNKKGHLDSDKMTEEISDITRAAQMILKGDITNLKAPSYKDKYYYELSSEDKGRYAKVKNNLDNLKVVKDPSARHGYRRLDGTELPMRVHDLVKNYYLRVYRNPNKEQSESSILMADKGTVLHKYEEEIMRAISEDDIPNQSKITQSIIEEFSKDPSFEEYDRNFYILTEEQFTNLVKGLKVLYNQIQTNQKEINKQNGTNDKATLYFELPIGDENMGGTVDLLVLYSNGTVGLYDYKNMSFKTFRGQVLWGTSEVKELAFDIQLTQYKNILYNNYGINEFAETRVVPINAQYYYKNPKNGFKLIEIGDGINEDKEYLDQIPLSEELTSDKNFNIILERMYKRLTNLRAAHKERPYDKEIKSQISRLDRLVKNLVVKRNFRYAYDELKNLIDDFDKRKLKLSDDPHSVSISYLNDIRDSIEVFKDFATLSEDEVKKLNDPFITALVEKIPSMVEKVSFQIHQKTLDVLRTSDSDNIDITKPGKAEKGWGLQFKALSEISHPVFQKLSKWIRTATNSTRNDMNKAYQRIQHYDTLLENWAKSQGMTRNEAFLKIYNKETGNLIDKYTPKFWDDIKAARANSDRSWMIKYYNIEYDNNGTLRYTGKSKEYFDKALEGQVKWLERTYPGDTNKTLRDKLLKDWRSKYDIALGDSALFNKNNRFLSINFKAVGDQYISEEFKYVMEHKPLLEYYDMYTEFNREFERITGRRINSNFVANIRQDLIDRLSNSGVKAVGSLKNDLLGSLELRDYNAIFTKEEADRTDLEGNTILHVPIFYLDPLQDTLSAKERKEVESIVEKSYTKGTMEYNQELNRMLVEKQREKGLQSKSFDLSRSLLLMCKSVYNFKHMSEIEGLCQALLHEVRTKKVFSKVDTEDKNILNRFNGKVISKLGLPADELAALESFINLYVYGKTNQTSRKTFKIGQKIDEEGNVISQGKEISQERMISNLIKYSSMAMLGLKPVLIARNFIQLKTNTYFTATEGQFFTMKDHLNGLKEWSRNHSKYMAAVEFFQTYSHDIFYEKANNLSSKKLSKYLTLDNMFIGMKATDENADRQVLINMMLHYGVDENGKIQPLDRISDKTSLYDRFSVDNEGNAILKGVSPEQIERFRAMVQKVATKVKGTVPAEDRMLFNTTTFGQLVMQYRSWLPGMLKARFSNINYDPVLDTADMGRYLVAFQDICSFTKGSARSFLDLAIASLPVIGLFMGNNIHTNKAKAMQIFKQFQKENPDTNYTFDEFVKLRMAKLKAMALEIQTMLGLFMLAMLAKGLIPDDKEANPVETFLSQNLYRVLNGAYLEASFFLNLTSATEIVSSPFALVSFATTAYRLASNTLDETRDLLVGKDYKGFIMWEEDSKDKTKPFYYTSRMIPGVNAITDFFDIYDTFNTSTSR